MRNLHYALLILFVTACSATAGNIGEKDMARAAADLHRLSYAVQGEIMRGAGSDEDLVALACGRDQTLCSTVSEFHISLKREGDNVVLMLCTKDQQRALIEDIACSPPIDFRPWEQGVLPCVFTLNAANACP